MPTIVSPYLLMTAIGGDNGINIDPTKVITDPVKGNGTVTPVNPPANNNNGGNTNAKPLLEFSRLFVTAMIFLYYSI